MPPTTPRTDQQHLEQPVFTWVTNSSSRQGSLTDLPMQSTPPVKASSPLLLNY